MYMPHHRFIFLADVYCCWDSFSVCAAFVCSDVFQGENLQKLQIPMETWESSKGIVADAFFVWG